MSVTPFPVRPRILIVLVVFSLPVSLRAIPVQDSEASTPGLRAKIDQLLSESETASKRRDLKGALKAASDAHRMAEGALPADDALRTRAFAELVRLEVLYFAAKGDTRSAVSRAAHLRKMAADQGNLSLSLSWAEYANTLAEKLPPNDRTAWPRSSRWLGFVAESRSMTGSRPRPGPGPAAPRRPPSNPSQPDIQCGSAPGIFSHTCTTSRGPSNRRSALLPDSRRNKRPAHGRRSGEVSVRGTRDAGRLEAESTRACCGYAHR